LRAGRGQVDDGKPGVAEADTRIRIDEDASRIRPSMSELRRHGARNRFELLRAWATL
jgi:hypothetical protein